jgi:hypothetical protein
VNKKIVVLTFMLAAVLVPLAAQQATEELKLKLPKPMFIGTPTNIKSANLEAVTGKSRAPFMVPVGTKLLSLKRPVTASDTQPVIGELDMITDGEKAATAPVELGPQAVIQSTGRVVLAARHPACFSTGASTVTSSSVSDDKDFLKGVQTIFNNDHDNSSGLGVGKDKEYIEVAEGRLFDPKGVKGRYVRMYSSGNTTNDLNHYVEIEVYGTPAK